MTGRTEYLPDIVGGGYGDFWRFKGRYRVVKGSRASKKSKTTALNIIYRMMKYPGSNTLVVRRVYRTLKDSCYTELKWAIRRFHVEKFWSCRESPPEITYRPTGQKIYFRGLDDPYKITSISADSGYLCWLWLEEAYEVMKEDDFNTLDESIRGEMPAGLFKQLTLTLNPWNDQHWIKRRFYDAPKGPDVFAGTTNYLCNEFLDKADRRVFETMREQNPRRYKVAGLGDWGVTKGIIFENWHTEDLTEKKKRFSNVYNGLDFGFAEDPTALVRIDFEHAEKKIYVFEEMYKCGMLTDELSDELHHRIGTEYITCDSASPQNITDLCMHGIRAIGANKGPNSINFGIQWLMGYEMIVDPSCHHFISEISNYRWDEDRFGNTLQRPVDQDNHLMDALRYATESLQNGFL